LEKIVEYAEPNVLQKATFHQPAPQNEPRFENQWHLKNTGQNGGIVGADVNAIGAWDITTGSSDIAIAIIDSGVDINHPDIKANILQGWDFDNSDNDPTNFDHPHGTACAGIIAAAVNDNGITGIAPGCRIIPIKAERGHSWEEWAKIFDWAVEQGGKIISCSWSITENSTVSLAIRRAVQGGVTVLCSVGNYGSSNVIEYPACLDETIAVGACTNQNVHADYSRVGNELDVVAPSSGGTLKIETTDVVGKHGYNRTGSPDGDYCDAKGLSGFGFTSAANALTTGIAGLMLSINPTLTPGTIRDILHQTADKIDTANGDYNQNGWSPKYGYGKVNAAAAVKMAESLI
jgi:subtilisin family serine protease